MCDGVISEVWGSVQRFNRAHLPFGTTEETSRVTGAHPHHPPGNGDQRINQHSQVSSPHDTWLQQGFTMCPACLVERQQKTITARYLLRSLVSPVFNISNALFIHSTVICAAVSIIV